MILHFILNDMAGRVRIGIRTSFSEMFCKGQFCRPFSYVVNILLQGFRFAAPPACSLYIPLEILWASKDDKRKC